MNDIDRNIYEVVTIGTQVWMAENLKTSKLNDGTPINLITDVRDWKGRGPGQLNPQLCWYNFETENKAIYGGLYDMNSIIETNKLCPIGWTLPSKDDWEILKKYLGREEGYKMKETGTIHWIHTDPYVTNESGFTALPGGLFDGHNFDYIGERGYRWSGGIFRKSLIFTMLDAGGRDLDFHLETSDNYAYSVRCIKSSGSRQ